MAEVCEGSPSLGIFIGRFQPFHLGHQFIVQEALKKVDYLVLVVGSSTAPPSLKNPFSIEDRVSLVESNLAFFLSREENRRVFVISVRDFPNDQAWMMEILASIAPFVSKYGIKRKILIGHDKDESTYYLENFKGVELLLLKNFNDIDGTAIRNRYFALEDSVVGHSEESLWRKDCSRVTQRFLDQFRQTPAWLKIITGHDS